MKKILISMLAIQLGANAFATTLTFDDIGSGTWSNIPNGYGGMNWSSFGYVNGPANAPASGYASGVVSGSYVAFNAYAATATVSSGTFDFNSAYITAAWNNGLSVKVDGYLSGSPLYSTTVNPSYSGPTLYAFNYTGIDELRFSSFGGVDANPGDNGSGVHFAMDNFAFNASVAPEPTTTALALLGMGALVLNRRIARG